MLTLILGATAMAVRDCLLTFTNVAQNRDKEWLAGWCSAFAGLAGFAVTAIGAGALILHGVTPHTIEILAVFFLTDLLGNKVWTHLARRIGEPQDALPVATRVARLERKHSRLHDRVDSWFGRS